MLMRSVQNVIDYTWILQLSSSYQCIFCWETAQVRPSSPVPYQEDLVIVVVIVVVIRLGQVLVAFFLEL